MQEKTKKRISVISMLAAVLASIIMQLLLPGLVGVRAEAASSSLDVDITATDVRSDLISMKEDNLSYISDKENIFISMAQYFDLNGNPRTYIYMNYIGDPENDVIKVSLSTATSDKNYEIEEAFNEYELKFINKDSQCNWCKFEILGLKNLDYTTRRYYLSELIIPEVEAPLKIDQVYIYNGMSNKTIKVFNQEVETIEITDSLVRAFSYGNEDDFGASFGFEGQLARDPDGVEYYDNFYIFFNTDKKIDELLEAEISFQKFDYKITWHGVGLINFPVPYDIRDRIARGYYPDTITDILTVNSIGSPYDKETVIIYPGETRISYDQENWYGGYKVKYKILDNIIDMKSVLKENGTRFEFYDEAQSYNWGVNFYKPTKTATAERTTTDIWNDISVVGKSVTSTAVLRLKFMTDGVVHNCYAVGSENMDVSAGNLPSSDSVFDGFLNKAGSIFLIILVFVLLATIAPLIKPLVDGVVQIVMIPFNLIGSLFKKKK